MLPNELLLQIRTNFNCAECIKTFDKTLFGKHLNLKNDENYFWTTCNKCCMKKMETKWNKRLRRDQVQRKSRSLLSYDI